MQIMQKLRQKAIAAGKALGSAGGAVLLFAENARAALPPDAEAAFTAIKGNMTDTLGAVWPIVILGTGGWILIKLFKKGANKAV
jgi:hypothetical protein